MNFIEAANLARSPGNAIRCKGWVEGVVILWSWDHMKWLGREDYRASAYKFEQLVAVPNHPHPNDIQRNDWEVVQITGEP